ncbi:MAG: hypothetical protein JNK50_04395 [Bacteroidia bacterium]|nr:hypothetical protein [Bacteroidia bacterium]
MAKQKIKNTQPENIPLYRAGNSVNNFFNSFGNKLRETRLTAALGYLIAEQPFAFKSLFGINGEIIQIEIESFHERDRADIQIETSHGRWIVEAKIDYSNPIIQSKKYAGQRKILLTNSTPNSKQKELIRVKYVNWESIHQTLLKIGKSAKYKLYCDNLIQYLKYHKMVKVKNPTEVYAREINDHATLDLFLKSRAYCCDFIKESSKLYEAIYFAPHFGNKLAKEHSGIVPGISYIARIESREIVEDWKHFIEVAKKIKSKRWLTQNKDILDQIKKWDWKDNKRILFSLGEPIHAFSPSIKKDNLQSGHGWLSKAFISFEELFLARERKIFDIKD